MQGEKTHVLVIPSPTQGHINPILQFSKRLASHNDNNLEVTLLTTFSLANTLQTSGPVKIEPISDGSEADSSNESTEAYLVRFKESVLQNLPNLIEERKGSAHPVKAIIYDSVMPWVLDMADSYGLYGVAFFTQSCAVSSIYYHVHQGALEIPIKEPTVSLPSVPELRVNEVPSLIHDVVAYPSFLTWALSKFSNLRKAKWILFNSFDELEQQAVGWMASQWPIKTIGPTLPSMYLDKRIKDDKEYGLNTFKPNVEACTSWLNSKQIGSVIYISFGSLTNLDEKQVEEIVLGLKMSNCNFLWVVRESEWHKLPDNFTATSETGLVVTWCSQLDVLAHQATGCFITHCGWNSVMEAVSLGIPMVAVPQWTDQPTNAKFIEDVWKIGVRAKADEADNIIRKEEFERCIREIMEGERGKEMRNNAAKWKRLSKEAIDEGGSSDKNIEEFVRELVNL